MFSKQLIDYTEKTFKQNKIGILTKTMVKEIKPKSVVVMTPEGEKKEIPFGLLVWAGVRSDPQYRCSCLRIFYRAIPCVR